MLLPEGLIPASYSPFTKDGRLDAKVLEERLESVLEGATGLHGPTNHGEMCSLTFDEWKLWIDVMVSVAKKAKVNTWAFFGAESFEKTIPYAEYALNAGADGFILHPPYKVRYSQDAAYLYVRDFAKEFPETPIVTYPNFSTETPSDPYLVNRIAQIPNIVGTKMTRIFNIEQAGILYSLTRKNEHFRLVTGSILNMYALRGLRLKASFSPQSNYNHAWSLQLWKALQSEDWNAADYWFEKMAALHHALNHPGGHLHTYAGEKAAMELLGIFCGPLRRPGLPPTEAQLAVIKKALEDAGLLK